MDFMRIKWHEEKIHSTPPPFSFIFLRRYKMVLKALTTHVFKNYRILKILSFFLRHTQPNNKLPHP